jgi:hypothetical protein
MSPKYIETLVEPDLVPSAQVNQMKGLNKK